MKNSRRFHGFSRLKKIPGVFPISRSGRHPVKGFHKVTHSQCANHPFWPHVSKYTI